MLYKWPGLLDRLKRGESVIIAEGYLFEFEHRGYLQAGNFIPEVVLDHPELVKVLYEEFAHAGSDVMLAFTVSVFNSHLYQFARKHLCVIIFIIY